jgi:hypothetical protein
VQFLEHSRGCVPIHFRLGISEVDRVHDISGCEQVLARRIRKRARIPRLLVSFTTP